MPLLPIIYYLCGKDIKIMKIILLLLAIFALGTTSAQSLVLPFDRTEPFRTPIIPYGRAADAEAGDVTRSNYVAKLAEWSVSEDGKQCSTSFAVPVWWLNRQTLVRVGRSTSAYEVLVDNRVVGYACSGATPVEFNITKLAKEGRHTLTIRQIDAEQNRVAEQFSLEPLVEDVAVVCQPTIRVRDIKVSTTLNDADEGVAQFAVAVKCDALNAKRARIGYALHLNDSTVVAKGYSDISLDMRREDTLRFVARIPKSSLWSLRNPHLVSVELETRIDNRPAEYVSQKIGIRSADVVFGKMHLNRLPLELKLSDYDPTKPIAEQVTAPYNGVVVPAYYATDKLLSECDRVGIAVVVRTAINTLTLGDHIRLGGNPSNDPFWLESYLSFNRAAYYTTRNHPSVLGFAIAAGKTTGINAYESYLMLKTLEPRLPIIYEGAAGEWCTDKITIR